jgi:Ni/Co efflux regulator RcnB
MKKFILAGIAAIAIAALAPQTQAAPPVKHSASTATHTQAKSHSAPAKFGGKRSAGPDRRVAGKHVDAHGRNVRVARDNRFGHGEQIHRDDRQHHEEELRNERQHRDRF